MKQRELCMLNHIAHVVLKQHYFSISCRGAASTAFRCVGLKKTSPREKVNKKYFLPRLHAATDWSKYLFDKMIAKITEFRAQRNTQTV